MQPTVFTSLLFGIFAFAGNALAAPPTREECVAAHIAGQERQDRGELSTSRAQFLVCAQRSCPALVAADCAKSASELERLVPTLTFVAHDANGADVAAHIHLDGKLVDGNLRNTIEVDPGVHNIRFSFQGKETTVRVTVSSGEKAKRVEGVFLDLGIEPTAPRTTPAAPLYAPESPSRANPGPIVLASLGAVGVVAGAIVVAVGLRSVPESCSRLSQQCEVPDGAPAIGEASDAIRLANLGGIVAATSGAVLVGGVVWALLSSNAPQQVSTQRLHPPISAWWDTRSAGLSYGAHF